MCSEATRASIKEDRSSGWARQPAHQQVSQSPLQCDTSHESLVPSRKLAPSSRQLNQSSFNCLLYFIYERDQHTSIAIRKSHYHICVVCSFVHVRCEMFSINLAAPHANVPMPCCSDDDDGESFSIYIYIYVVQYKKKETPTCWNTWVRKTHTLMVSYGGGRKQHLCIIAIAITLCDKSTLFLTI